jgi:hypothetical protein
VLEQHSILAAGGFTFGAVGYHHGPAASYGTQLAASREPGPAAAAQAGLDELADQLVWPGQWSEPGRVAGQIGAVGGQ